MTNPNNNAFDPDRMLFNRRELKLLDELATSPREDRTAALHDYAKFVEREKDGISLRKGLLAAHILGMVAVGTTESKAVHCPVPASNFEYNDLKDSHKKKRYAEVEDGQNYLQVSINPDITTMMALFGSINYPEQTIERCLPHTGYAGEYGWGTALSNNNSGEPSMLFEHGRLWTHALGRLMNVATHPKKPFIGAVDCGYAGRLTRVSHECGQYLTQDDLETKVTFKVDGRHDLPIETLVADYMSLRFVSNRD